MQKNARKSIITGVESNRTFNREDCCTQLHVVVFNLRAWRQAVNSGSIIGVLILLPVIVLIVIIYYHTYCSCYAPQQQIYGRMSDEGAIWEIFFVITLNVYNVQFKRVKRLLEDVLRFIYDKFPKNSHYNAYVFLSVRVLQRYHVTLLDNAARLTSKLFLLLHSTSAQHAVTNTRLDRRCVLDRWRAIWSLG